MSDVMDVKLTPFQERVMVTLYTANHRGLFPTEAQMADALDCNEKDVLDAMHILEVLGFVERANV